MTTLCDIGQFQVACSVSGTGPPLLLIHGAEGSHHMFDRIVPCLAQDFTVIAYDQRDCGETVGNSTSSSLLDLAHDAKELLTALGHERAHIYGTSFGGRVAQALAHTYPEVIDRLILGSTWPLHQALEELNGDGVREIYALRSRLPESAQALAGYFLPQEYLDLHPELKNLFKSVQPQSERSQRRACTVRDCPPLHPPALNVPTLVIAGKLDRIVPYRVTLDMAAAIPNSQGVLLQGVGHAGVIQAPEQIATHVRRFLHASKN